MHFIVALFILMPVLSIAQTSVELELVKKPIGVDIRHHVRDYGFHLSLDRLIDRYMSATEISEQKWHERTHNETSAIHTKLRQNGSQKHAVFYDNGDIKVFDGFDKLLLRGAMR